jgi:glucosamine-6-phosphate deaminase
LRIRILEDKASVGRAAAEQAAETLRAVLREQESARIVAATGSSQFEFLDELTAAPGIDWPRVEMFHLDEYLGLPATHPASFRKYLRERLIQKTSIARYHLLDGEADPQQIVAQVGREILTHPVDVAFVGIGENGHLAFNDPPADFATSQPYIIVTLDEACRRQQLNEGWFGTFEDVPTRAISMSIHQILQAKQIIAIVPEERKAHAIKTCLEIEISPDRPASILRKHANTTIYLDRQSASLLSAETIAQFQLAHK